MRNLQARPTEYRGITYKSKAEARLALLLDDLGKCWKYEPESMVLEDGYVPDFLVFSAEPHDYEEDVSANGSALLELSVIEYKPSLPTRTYIKELAVRFGCIGDAIYRESTLNMLLDCAVNVEFLLLIGGMGFSKARHISFGWGPPEEPCYIGALKDQWGGFFEDVDIDKENKRLSKYRFDLEYRHA